MFTYQEMGATELEDKRLGSLYINYCDVAIIVIKACVNKKNIIHVISSNTHVCTIPSCSNLSQRRFWFIELLIHPLIDYPYPYTFSLIPHILFRPFMIK